LQQGVQGAKPGNQAQRADAFLFQLNRTDQRDKAAGESMSVRQLIGGRDLRPLRLAPVDGK
jgi:hypothetical protein